MVCLHGQGGGLKHRTGADILWTREGVNFLWFCTDIFHELSMTFIPGSEWNFNKNKYVH